MIAASLLFLFLAGMGASKAAPSLPQITDLSAQDTLAKAAITPTQQREIANLIEENSTDWERGRIKQMRARRVALSAGKTDGLILRSTAPEDCGGTGNCMLVVLRRQGPRWQVLLPEAFADGFGFSRTAQNGVYDLVLSANDSAGSSSVTVLAFDGSRYRSSNCFRVIGKVATPVACAAD